MDGKQDPAEKERGEPASFDPASGAVHGSGSGAGGGNAGEDYDFDPMAGAGSEPQGGPANVGSGHPLPESEESRRGEVPESLEQAKGDGEDGRRAARPDGVATDPEGEQYPT